ncbi:MAG: hypothetical protein LBI84_00060 [Propionibacteriaceae bacterium]|jgi:hypothetical protein|nr:hypothetical protein [Propionibacteriaceae bacterium]
MTGRERIGAFAQLPGRRSLRHDKMERGEPKRQPLGRRVGGPFGKSTAEAETTAPRTAL